MTQRYPKTLWNVFHGMFTTDEMNAVEEWGFTNLTIAELERVSSCYEAAIHKGTSFWFPELRAAQQIAYVEIKQWYEENIRPKIEAEKETENVHRGSWFMGGQNAEQLKHTIEQIDKQKGKA